MSGSLRIKILDDTVANQIAAGEVVERPSSVVKELVENSLDAGASSVTVVISDGGRSLIQVIDDGHGMEPEDAQLSIERFATSKISSSDELQRIATFGFRGEALPSIASVSRLTLESSTGNSGTELLISGGKREHVIAVSRAKGTAITVRDLFYNTPARKNFLRGEKSELSQIRTALCDFAVSHPAVRFSLVSDGAEILTLAARSADNHFYGFKSRVIELKLLSDDALECSGEIDTPSGLYRVQAVLTKPLDCVPGSARLRFLVNGRAVKDKVLLRAVRDAYGNFLRADRYPAGVLKLTVPPSDIDVNVHPQKAEVRFRAPERIFSVVRQAIGAALRTENTASRAVDAFMPNVPESSPSPYIQGLSFNFSEGSSTSFVSEPVAAVPLHNYRYVGQIFDCYLLLESGKENFAIVDMHAAHERVVFAQLKKSWVEGETISQKLLIPESVNIPNQIRAEISEVFLILESLGFEIELLSNDSLVVRAVPAVLSRISPSTLIRDILSEITPQDVKGALERQVDAVLSRIACHGSVRSGKKMNEAESYQLLEDLESTELRAFCPHGRSVSRVLTKGELERLFGRSE